MIRFLNIKFIILVGLSYIINYSILVYYLKKKKLKLL